MYLDKETYKGLIPIIARFSSRVQQLQSGTLALMVQPISKSMVEASRARGFDPMQVEAQAQLWATVNVGWANASDDATVDRILKDCIAEIDSYAKDQGKFDSLRFINDAAPAQRPLISYGQESYDRLKAASRKYDPQGTFQKLMPGGYKL